ncbi:amino acid transporter [Gonapodya prolifera JEL478]|uniref:Amino acid transporter n=1 Tax=Gonapodya prolifera (strain JEL478) TaxID=1344416 RepID=A0A138ZZ82_GONPJ|nr:amino acid transporter [Gonapodya prolifera JEL478]|eukprot:KXS09822.1 amino acid transporter [Gonapodya prolifera JEL478]
MSSTLPSDHRLSIQSTGTIPRSPAALLDTTARERASLAPPITQKPKRTGLPGLWDRIVSLGAEGTSQKVSPDFVEKRKLGTKVADAFSIYSFAILAVMSGWWTVWTAGLPYGWGSLMLSFLVMASGFWTSSLCWAELTSALPFAGGPTTWGNAAFGSIGGTIMGQLNLTFWILTTASAYVAIGGYISSVAGVSINWAVSSLVILILINLLLALEVKWAFWVMRTFATVTLLFILLWFCLSVKTFDFQANVVRGGLSDADVDAVGWPTDTPSIINFEGFVAGLVISTWFFAGVECLPHAAEEAVEIPKSIPRSTHAVMLTLFALSFLILLMGSACSPGIFTISTSLDPVLVLNMNAGLNVPYDPMSATMRGLYFTGLWALFGAIFAAIYATSRIIYANARGGYLPSWLALTTSTNHSPVNAQVASSAVTYVIALIVGFCGDPSAYMILIYLGIVYEQLTNLFKALVYIQIARKMPTLPRPYKSPLGIPGAVFAAAVMLACVISMLVFQPYTRITTIVFAVHTCFCVPFYAFWVKWRLLMTPEKTSMSSTKRPSTPGNQTHTASDVNSYRDMKGTGAHRTSVIC